jgi:environmental stress-induced protein Ves
MNVYQIEPKDFITSQWSGGTTTQLFIHPSSATYAQRNFDFRLSSAIVSHEDSVFTSLPGISRKLMILDGQIQIKHKYHYSKCLQKYEQDAFQGDWNTTSKGTCIDFNLMTTGDLSTVLNHVFIDKKQDLVYSTKSASWVFIYVSTGEVTIDFEGKNYILLQNHLLVIQHAMTDNLKINGSEISNLVVVLIQQLKNS